jgi:hypothetical protein
MPEMRLAGKRVSLVKKLGIGFLIFMGIGVLANASKRGSGTTAATSTEQVAAAAEPAPGRVGSINKDMFDNIIVEMSSGQMFADVGATVQASQKSVAARLSKRQQVTVLCRGNGKVLTSPMLEDCLIQ